VGGGRHHREPAQDLAISKLRRRGKPQPSEAADRAMLNASPPHHCPAGPAR
jgi:hypothetical protein